MYNFLVFLDVGFIGSFKIDKRYSILAKFLSPRALRIFYGIFQTETTSFPPRRIAWPLRSVDESLRRIIGV